MTARRREWPISESNAMLPPSGYGAFRGWAASYVPECGCPMQPFEFRSITEQRENKADVLPQQLGSLLRRKVVVKVP